MSAGTGPGRLKKTKFQWSRYSSSEFSLSIGQWSKFQVYLAGVYHQKSNGSFIAWSKVTDSRIEGSGGFSGVPFRILVI